MNVQEKLEKVWGFISLNKKIKWWEILIIYAVFLLFFYGIIFTLRKGLTWELIIPFLLLLGIHLEFSILRYFNPKVPDKIRESLDLYKRFLTKRQSSFKIQYKGLIFNLILYVLLGGFTFLIIGDIYQGTLDISHLGIILVLTVIKSITVFNISEFLSLTKDKQGIIFTFLMSPIIVGLIIAISRFINQHQAMVSDYYSKVYDTFVNYPISFMGYISILIIIVFNFLCLRSPIKTSIGEGNLRRNMSNLFIGILLFLMISGIAFIPSPSKVEMRFSNSQTSFLFGEIIVFLFLLTFCSVFLKGVKQITKEGVVDGVHVIKIKGKIKGFASYIYESPLLTKIFYKKKYNFLILDTGEKSPKYVLFPKKNAIFSEEHSFYPGEEVEFYGYEIASSDLNKSKEILFYHYVPIIFRIIDRSILRRVF